MKEYIRFAMVLLVISAISAGVLNFVNMKTNPIIEKRERENQIKARQTVYQNADFFDENKKIIIDKYSFVPAYSKNQLIGYVVNGIGKGYGGDITFTLAFSIDGKIKGLKILSAKETPGLGDKIFNQSWIGLWVDRDKNYQFKVGPDSFAGATISPRAVYKEIMNILTVYDEKVKK